MTGFVLSKYSNALNDLIENTWKMNNAKAFIEREKSTRMEILTKCQSESCVDGCDMEWYECARQRLQLNSIKPFVFADDMSDLLTYERDKFRNVLIVGLANRGQQIYAWVGADQAEVTVLQDFRWGSELI